MSAATEPTTISGREFRLPDVGEGLTEADIVTWHVAVGDIVEENQVLVDIETAKSIVELPSPYAGEVTALLVHEGETVPVGAPIIRIGPLGTAAVAEGHDESPPSGGGEAQACEGDDTPQPLVGYGSRPETRRGSRSRRSPSSRRYGGTDTDRPRAKPPVRRLAGELGVDLGNVTATGAGRVVTRADVEAHAAGRGVSREVTSRQGDEPAADGREGWTRIPVTGVRKRTAAAMSASVAHAPHATLFTTVDVTRMVELRATLRRRPEFAHLALSPLTLVARAYLRALGRTPVAHARWAEETDGSAEILIPPHVGLGIAAATPRGLVVPVIARAETLALDELAARIVELTAVAREGRTPPEEMTGGTTTITNVGVFGIDGGTPILNPGETSILAVGAIRRRPWVVGGSAEGGGLVHGAAERIEPRSVMQLSFSFDHRVMDGAEAARVLAETADVLADPGVALL